MQETYSYSSAPHALSPNKLKKNKPKYRSDEKVIEVKDDLERILHDSRIASKISKHPHGPALLSKSLDISRKKDKILTKNPVSRSISGRLNIDLEELNDRPVEIDETSDILIAALQPNSPQFVKAKITKDSATQLENGDLFEFDIEVEPYLEILVGRTLHVSVIQLKEEQEFERLKDMQEEFDMLKKLEIAELQRLEADIKRRTLEKERRETQEKKTVENETKMEKRAEGTALANQFINELDANLFDSLQRSGHFDNPTIKEIREKTLPALFKRVISRTDLYEAASIVATELLQSVIIKAEEFGEEQMHLRELYKERLRQEANENMLFGAEEILTRQFLTSQSALLNNEDGNIAEVTE